MTQESDGIEPAQKVTIISDYPSDSDDNSEQAEIKTSFRLLQKEFLSVFVTVFTVFFALLFFTYSAFFKDSQAELEVVNPETEFSYALKVDLNSADSVMFDLLPGIGPKIAERIVEYRQKNSGFKNIEELVNIKGISLRMVNTIRPFVYIEQTQNSDE